MITDRTLPYRRLLFVRIAKDYCVVDWEKGGIAAQVKAALFHLTGDRADLKWVASFDEDMDSLNALRQAVQKGQFFSERSESL